MSCLAAVMALQLGLSRFMPHPSSAIALVNLITWHVKGRDMA